MSELLKKELRLGAFRAPVWVVLAALLISIFSVASVFFFLSIDRASTVEEHGRLITIYDDASEKTILSMGDTVADALAQAEIEVDPADIVEPALDSQLIASSYSVNIYRAKPVIVVDGNYEARVVTAAQTGKTIAQAASLSLYDEDLTEISRESDILASDGAIMRVQVVRAVPVKLVLYGQMAQIRTQADTVGDFLAEKGLVITADDYVIPSVEAPITAGMEIRIWREGVNTVTVDEEVDFPIETIQDNDQPVGYRKVQTAGVKGKRTVTYQIEFQGGVEVGRTEIQSITITEAKAQVEIVGTKVILPPGSHEDWMAAAGIDSADYGFANFIISHESGWGVTKSNYAGSGAYGLCQALPGSKMASAGADWATNPITQLRWCTGYARGRYYEGSPYLNGVSCSGKRAGWECAYTFWQARHWW